MPGTMDAIKSELIPELNNTVNDLVNLFESIDEQQINTSPYEGSWTAGELLRHVAKSTRGLHQMLSAETRAVTRDPGSRIPELKSIFLNFDSKMQSPEFIIPEKKTYEKQYSVDQFKKNFSTIDADIMDADLTQVVEGLPFGELTKLEMLHFLNFHTQRHLHQLNKIAKALKN